jgi:hypothetical protein
MRARIVAALVGAAAAVSLLVVPASAEEGGSDTRPCVTRNEFEAVSDGYSKERVNGVFDSAGELYGTITEPDGDVVEKAFRWNPCTDAAESDDYVAVEFRKACDNCGLRQYAKHWYVD